MELQIRVIRETLTDGSHVFNVRIGNYFTLHAYSERDARELTAQLRSAINVHTADTVHINSDDYVD
jgi:hypothetical protein